jgi:hypothetical protein
VPGYVVTAPAGTYLLTRTEIEPTIATFLHEMDVAIIKYQNTNDNM